ncbi:MAG: YciI family protein [Candidatus Sulfopaludibacter sp.]|nr:YciI family protein [Candidatus Sulfopaludibacter sp.]
MAKLQEHAAYLASQIQQGVIVCAGRTGDPVHPHGYAEIEVASEADAKTFIGNDPAVKAGVFECTLAPFSEVARAAR